jgi:hypothetical protein
MPPEGFDGVIVNPTALAVLVSIFRRLCEEFATLFVSSVVFAGIVCHPCAVAPEFIPQY